MRGARAGLVVAAVVASGLAGGLAACGRDPAAVEPAPIGSFRLATIGGVAPPLSLPDSVAGRTGTVLMGQNLWLGADGRGVLHAYLRHPAGGGRDTSYSARVAVTFTRSGDTLRLTFGGCPDGTPCTDVAFGTTGVLRDGALRLDRGIYPYLDAPHLFWISLPD